jgi:hypothetical protein
MCPKVSGGGGRASGSFHEVSALRMLPPSGPQASAMAMEASGRTTRSGAISNVKPKGLKFNAS